MNPGGAKPQRRWPKPRYGQSLDDCARLSEQISLKGFDGDGHVALQFRDEASGRFIFVDPDYAVVVRDIDGDLFCLQDLALRLTKSAEGLRIEKLATRYQLKARYNSKDPVNFAWSPDKDQQKPRIEGEYYFDLLARVTDSYVIRDYQGNSTLNNWHPGLAPIQWTGELGGFP